MNIEIIKDHTEEIAKKINEQFELEKDSIKEQLLEEIRGYITPVPKHYEWTRGYCPYDDSGEIYVDGLVSLYQTIAEFLENEYTGEKEATYESHRGFYYECYGDKLCYITQDIEGEILRKVTRKYLEELFGKELTEEEFDDVMDEYHDELYDGSIAYEFFWYETGIEFTGIQNMKLSELVEK